MPKYRTQEYILPLVSDIHLFHFLSSFVFTGTRSQRKEISETGRY
jgi:hypothetical protein